jgi:hypothetical protein
MREGLLSSRAYYIAAAIAFLIARSGTASADIGPPSAAFPDGDVASGPGLFRDGFGTSMGDFTSFGVGGKEDVSSLGSDNGPGGQVGAGPLPTAFDDLNADYSTSTPGDLFPATVMTGFEYVDPLIMSNDPTLFDDSDHVGGFSVNASGLWLLFPKNPPEDPSGRRASCSSDESIAAVGRCVMEGELSSLIATSPGAGSDPGDGPAQQIRSLPGSNPPFGGAMQMLRPEMIPAQNSFAMTWPSGVIQGTFPPACCDVTAPVFDDAFAPASELVNLNGLTADPLFGGTLGDLSVTPATSIPEIPPTAMLLIGFAGLALVGWRPLWSQRVSDSIVPRRDKLDAAPNSGLLTKWLIGSIRTLQPRRRRSPLRLTWSKLDSGTGSDDRFGVLRLVRRIPSPRQQRIRFSMSRKPFPTPADDATARINLPSSPRIR